MSRNRSRGLNVLATAVAASALAALAAAPAVAVQTPPTKLPGTDLALTKSADRTAYAPGDLVRYTITVRNAGSSGVAISRIRVSDPALPDLVRVPGPESADGVLDPGESLTSAGARTVTQGDCGPLSNTATVSLVAGTKGDDKDSAPDEDASNDSDTVVVSVEGGACAPSPAAPVVPPPVVVQGTSTPPPAVTGTPKCIRTTLTTRVAGPTGVRAGQPLGLRIRVANTGAAASGPVTLTVTLPRGLSVRSLGGGRSLRGGTLVVRVAGIPGGGARTVRVGLRADTSAAGARTVRASASAPCARSGARALTVRVAAALPRVQPAVTG